MHVLSKKGLSLAEMDTQKSRNPTTVVTANVYVQTNEEAQVCVHDIDLFVTVQLLEDTPALQSLGTPDEENGSSYGWQSGQKTRLTQSGREFLCKSEHFVPLVAPGLSSSFGTSSSSTSPPQDSSDTSSIPATQRSDKQAPEDHRDSAKSQNKKQKGEQQASNGRLFARPSGMAKGVHRKSRRHRYACVRTRCLGLRFGTSYESGIKVKEAQYLNPLPTRVKLRTMLANQDDKGSLKKAHW